MKAKKIDSKILYTLVVIAIIAAVVFGWSVITPEGRWRWGCSVALLAKGVMPPGCEVSPGGFNFDIDTSPNKEKITKGESVTATIDLNLIDGATKKVMLSASGLPTDSSVSFSTIECRPTCSSTMTISTRSTIPGGTYVVSVTGTGGTLVKTESYALTILTENLEVHALTDSIDVSATVVTELGDINWDGVIDYDDFIIFAGAYGSDEGDPNWDPNCDLDGDGHVGPDDFYRFAGNYGKTIEIFTTPFTIALAGGTYTLKAKYGTQIQTKSVNVVEGTLTRLDFRF